MAEGPALVTSQPLNFLSMVDQASGRITDQKHELYGKTVKGAVLVFPYAIGSSVGAYAIHSLKSLGNGPAAVICTKADITTASGCAIAGIPVVEIAGPVEGVGASNGTIVRVDAHTGQATVKV